ncbi:MAG TPA: sigma-70 family RNA polymerase sigma factor [Streptosporangiaceae bacterium]|nr:sigma-70 family RNA polymerase sigma factor [Streptosporangiaceae bacterium]
MRTADYDADGHSDYSADGHFYYSADGRSDYSADGHRPSADVLFERELGPCRRQLYPTALRMTGNSSDAEDLVQDTMTRAYAGLAHFTPGTNGRAWLFRIMANAFINISRHRQHQPAELLSADIDIPAPSPARLPADIAARSSPSAEEEVLSRLSQSEVRAALAELPVGFRAAIYLVDAEGYSYRDAAEMIGVPIGTVMSRLHRARKRVRQYLLSATQPCASN